LPRSCMIWSIALDGMRKKRSQVSEAEDHAVGLKQDAAIHGGNMKRKLHRFPWAKKEIATLKKMHPSHSNAEIAKALGRKVTSVVFKAHTLGLRKSTRRLKQIGRENIAYRWEK
jgi:hypothetical protein